MRRIARELAALAADIRAMREVVDAIPDPRSVRQKPLPQVVSGMLYVRLGDRNVLMPEYRKAYYEWILRQTEGRVSGLEDDKERGYRVNEYVLQQERRNLRHLRSIDWWEVEG